MNAKVFFYKSRFEVLQMKCEMAHSSNPARSLAAKELYAHIAAPAPRQHPASQCTTQGPVQYQFSVPPFAARCALAGQGRSQSAIELCPRSSEETHGHTANASLGGAGTDSHVSVLTTSLTHGWSPCSRQPSRSRCPSCRYPSCSRRLRHRRPWASHSMCRRAAP